MLILLSLILFFILRNKEERYYARISCIFEVYNHSEPLQIISDYFSHNLTDIEIIANGTKIEDEDDKKYVSNYSLQSNGFIDVIFNYRDNAEIYLDHIFKNITNLVSIKVASTEKAKILSMHKAFQNCSDVENITIKGFDTSSVTSMKKVFYNNSKLSSIVLDDYFSTENVEDMSYMFAGSHSNELNIKNFRTNKVKDMSYMFYANDEFDELNLNSFDTGLVESMAHMFDFCREVRSLDVSKFDKVK